jgi:hypothetical protein
VIVALGSFPSRLTKEVLAMGLLSAIALANVVVNAQSAAGPVLYRLNPGSYFLRGCFPPCMCPVMIDEPVSGTFLLTPKVANGFSMIYSVTEVHWSIANNGTNMSVTGSGTYEVGGELAPQQELSLYLQIDDGDLEHFDSGLVTNSVSFPNINISISTNHQYCFDTVFKISASPTPVPQLQLSATSSNVVLLSWPVSPYPFILLESTNLTETNWIPVTNTPTATGQENKTVLPLSTGMKCYRLKPGGS